MANYLVDYYSEWGRRIRGERFTAADDADAELAALMLVKSVKPQEYVIRRLERSGQKVIRDLGPAAL